MKLDYDCVRDLLLVLEEKLQFIEREDGFENPLLPFADVKSAMKNYSKSSVLYTTQKLSEAGYINILTYPGNDLADDICFQEITFPGHQYLDSIRSDSTWNGVKKKFADSSLSLTFELVKSVAISIASSQLGINL